MSGVATSSRLNADEECHGLTLLGLHSRSRKETRLGVMAWADHARATLSKAKRGLPKGQTSLVGWISF